jgi:hypothetical protein
MMPDGGAAHRLPPFEQCRSREFKLLARNPFPIIRKPDKNARTRISDTNPLEYRVGVTVDDEPDQNRTNSRRPAPRSATGNSEQLPGDCLKVPQAEFRRSCGRPERAIFPRQSAIQTSEEVKKGRRARFPESQQPFASPPADTGGAWILPSSVIERELRGLPASCACA